ncbi:MAG: FAD-binding protein [Nostoc sp.]|uniref:FAD-binding protein n=1 Tax=Nostoc sp. TaxID=1180 RepID=UPI002FF8329E
MNGIVQDLKHLIAGEVSNASEILTEVSEDFGGIFQKSPQVVVTPQNANDIAQTVKYAAQKGLVVSSRAAGHSLGGQSLNQDGIVLNMRNLDKIRDIQKDQLWFKADAGTSWNQVIDACIPDGLVPPVLTNYFGVSVGGTHSAGGIGAASFRYGNQGDNCLGVEVVTAEGEILWCSPEENSELFNHVLCGYGQFGIITQVQHKLKVYPSQTRTYLLFYDNLDALLDDKRVLVTEQRIDHLVSFPVPCLQGVSRATGIMQPLIQWFYTLRITVEANSLDAIDDKEILAGLNFYRHIHTEDLGFAQFIEPMIQVDSKDIAHPWMDVFLPASSAKDYIETALKQLPSFLDISKAQMGCFCLVNRNNTMPMFRLPQEEELIFGFGIYPSIPKSQVQPILAELKKLSNLSLEMGGKRYLTCWIDFTIQQWQSQFGDYWPKVNQIKSKYDPKGIFNSGFFEYEQIAHPAITLQENQLVENVATKSAIAV